MIEHGPKTALIVVDMQNDFADPKGSLFVEGGDHLVGAVNAEIIRATAAGSFVAYTQDWHPPSTPHFETDGGIWPVHCVGDTWGSDFHPRLIVAGPSIRKGTSGEDGYSGFSVRDPQSGASSPTELAAILLERSIQSIVTIGLALDYCVGATAEDSNAAGFDTLLPLALTAAVEMSPGDGAAMVERLRAIGVEVG